MFIQWIGCEVSKVKISYEDCQCSNILAYGEILELPGEEWVHLKSAQGPMGLDIETTFVVPLRE